MDQNHLFWVLSSQSYKSPLRVTSYKSDGLYLSIGTALARCEAASREAKLTEVSLTMAEKGGDLTGALHYIPVLSWGSWKTLRLNGDKKDVHCLVFYGFQNAPINVVPYKSLRNSTVCILAFLFIFLILLQSTENFLSDYYKSLNGI